MPMKNNLAMPSISISPARKHQMSCLILSCFLRQNPSTNPAGGPEILIAIHHIARIDSEQGCNVLFANGRVRYIKKENFSTLRWTAE